MEQTDGDLARASGSGDQDAYAELVGRHLKRVFAICLGILGDMTDAEDAAQEVFVRGFEKIGTLRESERFPAWIGQIARNRCRDLIKSRSRRREYPLTPQVEDAATPAVDGFRDLKSALSRLAEDDRLPLLLYYFDGKDTRTLADEMGLSQGGVCSRLYRARRRLRSLMQEEVSS